MDIMETLQDRMDAAKKEKTELLARRTEIQREFDERRQQAEFEFEQVSNQVNVIIGREQELRQLIEWVSEQTPMPAVESGRDMGGEE